jgi:hypothetical protein
MELSEALRDPMSAAVIGGLITAGYIHLKAKMNNEGVLQTHQYTKPAVLVALLVYFIVSQGVGAKESISTEPF